MKNRRGKKEKKILEESSTKIKLIIRVTECDIRNDQVIIIRTESIA